jgi:hypothetical protein
MDTSLDEELSSISIANSKHIQAGSPRSTAPCSPRLRRRHSDRGMPRCPRHRVLKPRQDLRYGFGRSKESGVYLRGLDHARARHRCEHGDLSASTALLRRSLADPIASSFSETHPRIGTIVSYLISSIGARRTTFFPAGGDGRRDTIFPASPARNDRGQAVSSNFLADWRKPLFGHDLIPRNKPGTTRGHADAPLWQSHFAGRRT